ncbi:MAG TPA: ThiF family adenylyltransferase [Candidatus Paceibacterota bacterium]|nr:ThiF family adenylyltransferase [Candidatus Paceibacterota bacterium]
MIDAIRHIEVFSPETFGGHQVDIVGVGATGSRIALSLAKLGLSNIHVWDFDHVEPHNVANQAFGNHQVGKLKVEALQELVKEQTGTEIAVHAERVNGTQRLGSVVFLLTDTMASRQEIWKAGIRYKPHVKLLIETRMGKNSGRIYAVNPSSPAHVKGWEATLYSDDVAEKSACGTSISVGPTAEVVSGLAVWQLIRWHQAQLQLKEGKKPADEMENELVFSLQPMMVFGASFK